MLRSPESVSTPVALIPHIIDAHGRLVGGLRHEVEGGDPFRSTRTDGSRDHRDGLGADKGVEPASSMNADDKIKAELEALEVLAGRVTRETRQRKPQRGQWAATGVEYETGWIDGENGSPEIVSEWGSRALALLQRLAPDDPAATLVQKATEDPNRTWVVFRSAVGALLGFKGRYLAGLLTDLRSEIRNEVHEDFLEQAEMFLRETTPVPDSLKCAATVLAGGVLEDALRKISDRHRVAITGEPSLAKLNDALRGANVYSKTQQKEIALWADFRNSAAHNLPNQVPIDQVGPMIQGIRRFMIEFKP